MTKYFDEGKKKRQKSVRRLLNGLIKTIQFHKVEMMSTDEIDFTQTNLLPLIMQADFFR